MYKYFFSIFARLLVAISGFAVFISTSKLYGAEGRGVIGFGTSLVSIVALLLSFNLGRSFLSQSKKNESLKQRLLPVFLAINYLLIIVGIFFSVLFWLLNFRAKAIIDFQTFLPFLILVPYYLWSVNGSAIYATLNQTFKQDLVVVFYRCVLFIFTLVVLGFNFIGIKVFLFVYAFILCFGTITEMALLGSPRNGFFQMQNIGHYISESRYAHIDYLAFNLYPLILMIFAGLFLKLSELGHLNFIIQLINFVFILSIVASLKMKSYVSTKGVLEHLVVIRKLLIFTLIASFTLIVLIYVFLSSMFFREHFPSFINLSNYFLLVSLAVPGYIAYQFIYPVLIEYNQIRLSMNANLLIFFIFISVSYFVLIRFGFMGGCILFSLFYLFVLVSQIYHLRRLKLTLAGK